MIRMRSLMGILALTLAASQVPAQTAVEAAHDGGGNRWVATWSSAPIAPGPTTIDAIFGNDRQPRIREPDGPQHRPHQRGRQARSRRCPTCSAAPLRIGAAQVALRRAGALSTRPRTAG